MQSTLSTSAVSLHSCVAYQHNNNNHETVNKTGQKPSVLYFLALFYAFFLFGMGAGLLGPTLLKYTEQLNTPLDQVIYILSLRSGGFLIGTTVFGTLIDHFPSTSHTILMFSVLTLCAATSLIPFIYKLIPMIFTHLTWAIAAGAVDNLAQILTIRHYENLNVNPYLQALHSAFGIGAFVAPLIIAPFLRKSSSVDQWHYAYWLIGCLHLPSIIWILAYARRDKLCSKQAEKNLKLERTDHEAEEKSIEVTIVPNEKSKGSETGNSGDMIVLGFIALFILLFVGCETSFGSYIHTYASLHLNFDKDIAAYLNSVYWASFAFSRLCGVAVSLKLSPMRMLLMYQIVSIGAIVLLLVLNKSAVILWVGSIIFGLGFGPIYPAAIAFTDKEISITGKRMSMLAIGGSIGDASLPLLVGHSISSKSLGPIGFLIILFIGVVLTFIVFGAAKLYTKYRSQGNKYANGENTEK